MQRETDGEGEHGGKLGVGVAKQDWEKEGSFMK